MSSAVQAERMTPRQKGIVLLIGAVQFVNILDLVIVMPLGPDFAAALDIPESHLGYVGGAYTAAACVSGLIGSLFLDRFDRRKALAVAMLGLVVGTASGALAVGSGTIRADRHQDVYRELVEIYRQQLVPSVIARHKLQCALGEAAQLSVRLDDGIFRTPLDPSITRVSIETGPLPLQLTFDGVARPFVNGMQVQVRSGQKLELADLSLHAAR